MRHKLVIVILIVLAFARLNLAQVVSETKIDGSLNKVTAVQSSPLSATIKQDVKGNSNQVLNSQSGPVDPKKAKKHKEEKQFIDYIIDYINATSPIVGLLGLILTIIGLYFTLHDRKKNGNIDKLFPFLALLSTYSIGQTPKANNIQSKIDVKGNKNYVQVVQGGDLINYDLSKSEDTKNLLEYLRKVPAIRKQLNNIENDLNKIKNQNKILIDIAQNVAKDGFINIDLYNKGLEKYIEENRYLKDEINSLKDNYHNTEFSVQLEKAEDKLEELDNQGYQQVLQEFKRRKKEKIAKGIKDIAQASYLQSFNSLLNFHYIIALEQITEALEYNNSEPKFLILKGDILTNLSRPKEALDIYLSIDTKNLNDTLKGTLFNQLGLSYYFAGEYEKAIESFEESLPLQISALGNNNANTAATYNNLGAVYQVKGYYDKAIEFFNKALLIDAKIFGYNHIRVAATYSNLGVAFYHKGEFEKAIQYYKRDIEITIKNIGEENPSIATTYNSLAISYDTQGDYGIALTYYRKALDIQLKFLQSDDIKVSLTYNNIGSSYHAQGEYKRAIEFYEKSLQIVLKNLGASHPDLITIYNNLGDCYRLKGDLEKANQYLLTALSIHNKSFHEDNPSVALIYNNLGLLYTIEKDSKRSIEFHSKALSIRIRFLGNEHTDVAMSYDNLGSAFYLMGNYNEAISYRIKALQIKTNALGIKNPATQSSMGNLGLYYLANQMFQEGFSYLKNTKEYEQMSLIDKVNFFNIKGVDAFVDRHYKTSSTFHNISLSLLRDNEISKNEEIWAIAYHNLARSVCAEGDREKALNYFNIAKKLSEENKNVKLIESIQKYSEECKLH